MTEEKFMQDGLKRGPALRLADFAKKLDKRKLKSFSSYKTLKNLNNMLRKYDINSNDIKKILLFVSEPVKIDETNKHFQYCITDIKRKMSIIGLTKSSNE